MHALPCQMGPLHVTGTHAHYGEDRQYAIMINAWRWSTSGYAKSTKAEKLDSTKGGQEEAPPTHTPQ